VFCSFTLGHSVLLICEVGEGNVCSIVSHSRHLVLLICEVGEGNVCSIVSHSDTQYC
jgi:hypothetical protein